MEQKIQSLLSKLPLLEEKLGDPNFIQDQKAFREATQEHSYLSELKDKHEKLQKINKQLSETIELLKTESDDEFIAMLNEEKDMLSQLSSTLKKEIENLLIPPDPHDNCNTIMELRAGTGGDEAALFVGDCLRMYRLFAEKMGWKFEIIAADPSEVGGFRDCVLGVSGKGAYRFLKYEGGTHRVQRVPATESQGRVHTSAITVAVLIESDDEIDIEINEKDLRIDTYRSSGAGGQHVNTTDSAVRITHIPTNIVAYCQQEKSQHKNKDKALRLLKAKLIEHERKKREAEISDTRSKQVGSGDRSERIRTYNFPQNRVTDHRINLTLYSLDRVMNGDLDEITNALVAFYYQKQFSE